MIHRPSIIAPRCRTCGGFTREWLRLNRRRAGFASWLHGACQCCVPLMCEHVAADVLGVRVNRSGTTRIGGGNWSSGGTSSVELRSHVNGSVLWSYPITSTPIPLVSGPNQYVVLNHNPYVVEVGRLFDVYYSFRASKTGGGIPFLAAKLNADGTHAFTLPTCNFWGDPPRDIHFSTSGIASDAVGFPDDYQYASGINSICNESNYPQPRFGSGDVQFITSCLTTAYGKQPSPYEIEDSELAGFGRNITENNIILQGIGRQVVDGGFVAPLTRFRMFSYSVAEPSSGGFVLNARFRRPLSFTGLTGTHFFVSDWKRITTGDKNRILVGAVTLGDDMDAGPDGLWDATELTGLAVDDSGGDSDKYVQATAIHTDTSSVYIALRWGIGNFGSLDTKNRIVRLDWNGSSFSVAWSVNLLEKIGINSDVGVYAGSISCYGDAVYVSPNIGVQPPPASVLAGAIKQTLWKLSSATGELVWAI